MQSGAAAQHTLCTSVQRAGGVGTGSRRFLPELAAGAQSASASGMRTSARPHVQTARPPGPWGRSEPLDASVTLRLNQQQNEAETEDTGHAALCAVRVTFSLRLRTGGSPRLLLRNPVLPLRPHSCPRQPSLRNTRDGPAPGLLPLSVSERTLGVGRGLLLVTGLVFHSIPSVCGAHTHLEQGRGRRQQGQQALAAPGTGRIPPSCGASREGSGCSARG